MCLVFRTKRIKASKKKGKRDVGKIDCLLREANVLKQALDVIVNIAQLTSTNIPYLPSHAEKISKLTAENIKKFRDDTLNAKLHDCRIQFQKAQTVRDCLVKYKTWRKMFKSTSQDNKANKDYKTFVDEFVEEHSRARSYVDSEMKKVGCPAIVGALRTKLEKYKEYVDELKGKGQGHRDITHQRQNADNRAVDPWLDRIRGKLGHIMRERGAYDSLYKLKGKGQDPRDITNRGRQNAPKVNRHVAGINPLPWKPARRNDKFGTIADQLERLKKLRDKDT